MGLYLKHLADSLIQSNLKLRLYALLTTVGYIYLNYFMDYTCRDVCGWTITDYLRCCLVHFVLSTLHVIIKRDPVGLQLTYC